MRERADAFLLDPTRLFRTCYRAKRAAAMSAGGVTRMPTAAKRHGVMRPPARRSTTSHSSVASAPVAISMMIIDSQ
jgi:hypothetical protein